MYALWDNPILYYEAMPKPLRRLTPQGQATVLGASALVGVLLGAWVLASYPDASLFIGYLLLSAWAALAMLLAVIQLANTIVNERQRKTWDALILTRLRPVDIVLGKALGTLLPLWLLGLLLLPMTLVMAAGGEAGHDGSPWYLLLIYAGAVICSASFGSLALYCSMCCTSVGAAQLLAFGLLFGINQVGGMVVMAIGWFVSYLLGFDDSTIGPLVIGAGIALYALIHLGPGFFFAVWMIQRFRRLERVGRR